MTTAVKLLKHANHVVAVNADGTAVLIDPATQRWQAYGSQRAAKWWASVRSRVEHGFGGQGLASDITCEIYIHRHQPKKESST